MAEPFLGEVRQFPFNFAPKGWAQCNGQLLPIQQNQALFSLLGTTYGGDGRTTFALPNLQGRVPVHPGQTVVLGQTAGEEAHTLTINEMPQHNHQAKGGSDATGSGLAGKTWGTSSSVSPFAPQPNTIMSPNAIAQAGGSQPHNNMQPYLVVNFCIALQGIYPPRD
ncbi:microcystin-dependent protein [Paenibacillus sp. BK033]|uniref:phage tail protein n=1 Tax=Paenibacillus sp. BK033 TaxID=2512133 RepID=UPI0010429B9A|nr:tail fiber protein [Paenibacillus sp. BK033]TCN00819.1 microcystin-dependent protein [Paenibacillus sp. BK033]